MDFGFSDLLAIFSGSLVGFILGVIGGGGSVLAVPLLVYVVGVKSPHIAIGTSSIAVALSALANLIHHARRDHVCWPVAILFGPSQGHMTKPTATESTAMSHSTTTHSAAMSAAAMSAAAMSAAATGRHDRRRTDGNNSHRGQCDHHPTHHSTPPLQQLSLVRKPPHRLFRTMLHPLESENFCSVLSRSRNRNTSRSQ
jgi:Sulfite exporter TauE/SafE